MLNVCESDGYTWNYREIYIHSKLMLIDGSFLALGSANMNQRSMAVDSELNLATDDCAIVLKLRPKIWSQLSGRLFDGGSGEKEEIKNCFKKWGELMKNNKDKKQNNSKMTGFLLPLEDVRSSTTKYG